MVVVWCLVHVVMVGEEQVQVLCQVLVPLVALVQVLVVMTVYVVMPSLSTVVD